VGIVGNGLQNNNEAGRRGLFRRLSHPNLNTALVPPPTGYVGGEALVRGTIGQYGLRDCLDGTANTIMVGETAPTTGRRELIGHVMPVTGFTAASPLSIAQQVRDPLRPAYYVANNTAPATSLQAGIGGDRWMAFVDNFFTTIIPPNGPSICGNNANACNNDIVKTAGSYHRGGCHVLLADGAVRFVTENIEAGNASVGIDLRAASNAGIESPRGLWGALGTRAGSENKSL
jgi:hypothetical protein